MIRTFRLTNEPGGLGLSCTPAGLSLAGVSLLQKTEAGFAPRSAPEIASLLKAAYGAEVEPTRLQSGLGAIAHALNGGDVARAGIAAVLTRTPELSEEAAGRLTRAEEELAKYNYNPAEPRDSRGRWTTEGGAGSVNISAPVDLGPARHAADLLSPYDSNPDRGDAQQYASEATADDSSKPNNEASDHEAREPTSPQQKLEQKYDGLGPTEFSKEVLQFGYLLETSGPYFSAAEKEQALAEYHFLQDRLSFWLDYEYKPPTAQGYLLGAASALYRGAVRAEIEPPSHIPRSMFDDAIEVWSLDNLPQTRNRPAKPDYEIAPAELPREAEREPEPEEAEGARATVAPSGEVEGLGGVVDNAEAKVDWAAKKEVRGTSWEDYLATILLAARRLHTMSKAFDFFMEATGEAISAKTLNTLCVTYIKYPREIYRILKIYIDAAADYQNPRGAIDLDPKEIQSKTLQLAVHGYTSPRQWRYLHAAFAYGKKRGVSVVITRLRE